MRKFAVRVRTAEQAYTYMELAHSSGDAAAAACDRFGPCGVTVIPLSGHGYRPA
ncbi:hypothetical protein RJO15_20980 [Herbaspirillum huttiense F1]|jgi:hypothetical protein|uniref:Transposase n=1 Tax=Herbaspirillum huttiense subsp. lycopersici TaxID=3074428 RepID=A0ABU2EUG4_9BURK|nr:MULTISPECIES: hypothetical protein [Herbaspirillum]MDR6738504.1 hypothetical protein [Herbaspirillum sp. 1173]MDR9851362.1 hypothetical protein [Herbaspirillum huttiense SE1]MDT0358275.1 hypothetical protein [Herbaspirillum huttiense F1]UWE18900.1 hypothetical protein NY669_12205 [Herbaspirillum huttiense]